jgi:uncharacterized protein (DUF1499 family)
MSALGLILGRGPRGLPPAQPLDLAALVLPASPNTHLAAPPGGHAQAHEAVPLLPCAPDEAWEALRQLGDGLPKVWKTGEWPALRQVQWVARTPLANFPDIVAGQVVELPGGSGVWLYSRSLIGWSDLGVNRRRIAAWRARLEAALRPR